MSGDVDMIGGQREESPRQDNYVRAPPQVMWEGTRARGRARDALVGRC